MCKLVKLKNWTHVNIFNGNPDRVAMGLNLRDIPQERIDDFGQEWNMSTEKFHPR